MINATSNSSNDRNTSISLPEPTSNASNSSMQKPPSMSTASTSQRALMNELPEELKSYIFQQLPHTVLFDRSLFAMACTSMRWRADVKAFLTPERACIGFGDKLLNKDGLALWQAEGNKLREQTPGLRIAFGQSRKLIEQALTDNADVKTIANALSVLAGIDLNFKTVRNTKVQTQILGTCREQTIKLSAGLIGRDRILKEVLPALTKIPAGCRVVLEASHNNLTPDDLGELLKVMKTNPCIVQLDLAGNSLCSDDEVSHPMVALFQLPSPLAHLYLAATNFNDQTACQISGALATNPCLRHLDLRRNLICEAGALALINALATTRTTGEVHTNTVLETMRLQDNLFKECMDNIFTAMEAAHYLIAKATPKCDEISYNIEVDGVDRNWLYAPISQSMQQLKFNAKAAAEKL